MARRLKTKVKNFLQRISRHNYWQGTHVKKQIPNCKNNWQSINLLETDINVNNANYTSHGSKDEEISKKNKTGNTRTLSCWLYKNNHRLMNWKDFLAKTPPERNNFVLDNKLCLNCLSKRYQLNDCQSDFWCHENNCNCKHYPLLHQGRKAGDLTINNCNIDRDIDMMYLQIIPVTIHNNTNSVRTWALLDTGSDATLTSEEIADKLKLKGEMRNISVSNVMSMENKLPSKLVTFSVSSNSHPERFNISNTWVDKNLTIQTGKMDTKNSSKVSLSSRYCSRHSNAIRDININRSWSPLSTFVYRSLKNKSQRTSCVTNYFRMGYLWEETKDLQINFQLVKWA